LPRTLWALGKEKRPSRRRPCWRSLCRVPTLQALGKDFLFFLKKNSLPSALYPALGKDVLFFFLKILCRVPSCRRSAKFEFFLKKKSLPSALWPALGKVWIFFKNKLFAEYRGHYTRQNWENGFPSTRQSDWKQPFLFVFYIPSKQTEDIYNKHHKLVSHYRCINMQYN